MKFRAVPAITARYWVAITLASVFGANLGDFVSRNLHMGHIRGVPYIAAAFVLIFVAGVFSRARWEGWYWLGIVAMRTIATNLADLATHDGALGFAPVCTVLAVAMVAFILIRRAIAPEAATAAVPNADLGYWLIMLTAGTLGTALGDGIADEFGLPITTLLTAIAVLLATALRARPAIGLIATYWIAIVAIRTFGTNAGDLIAHQWGLAVTTPVSGIAMFAVLALWRERPVTTAATAIPALGS